MNTTHASTPDLAVNQPAQSKDFVRYDRHTVGQKTEFANNKYLIENILAECTKLQIASPSLWAELERLIEDPRKYVEDSRYNLATDNGNKPAMMGLIQLSRQQVLDAVGVPDFQQLERHCIRLKESHRKHTLARYTIIQGTQVSFNETLHQMDLEQTATRTRGRQDEILFEACKRFYTSMKDLHSIPKKHYDPFMKAYGELQYLTPEDLFEALRQ